MLRPDTGICGASSPSRHAPVSARAASRSRSLSSHAARLPSRQRTLFSTSAYQRPTDVPTSRTNFGPVRSSCVEALAHTVTLQNLSLFLSPLPLRFKERRTWRAHSASRFSTEYTREAAVTSSIAGTPSAAFLVHCGTDLFRTYAPQRSLPL